MKPYIVAITGASGSVYGIRLVQVLGEAAVPVELVVSDTAKIVMQEEGDCPGFEGLYPWVGKGDRHPLQKAQGEPVPNIRIHDFHDFTASIASGSYPVEGMVIIPCSMGTLGAIASGLSQNLIHRAADCTIKEGRKLVLVPRETPLSAIHLENMLKLSRLGVRIVPAMPAFYSGQQSIQELIDFMVGKTLDQMGIPHALYPRWVGSIKKGY
jgi:flavin prenyltransferase